jgi:hypothetical protein
MSVRLFTNTVSKIASLSNSTNAALMTGFYKHMKNTAVSEIQYIFNSIIQIFIRARASWCVQGYSYFNSSNNTEFALVPIIPIITDVIDTNYILVLLSSLETSSM